MSRATRARGILLAVPDGTRDRTGKLFWNASDACCDFDGSPVDDIAYLDALLADVAAKHAVDARRVFLIGHSNGGFMAHAFACAHPDRVAAIVALAGVPSKARTECGKGAVSVLQVHGDADTVIAFEGGRSFGNGNAYPSAEEAVARWALHDGCGPTRHPVSPPLDLDRAVSGSETHREAYDCPAGVEVALWRMAGSAHVPEVDARFTAAVLDFVLAHPRGGA